MMKGAAMKILILSLFMTTQVDFNSATFIQPPFRCFQSDALCTTTLAQTLSTEILKTIPEPMKLDSIKINEEGLDVEMKDVNIFGLNKLIINYAGLDAITNMSRTIFHVDLFVTGRYKSNGNLMSTPIYGDGDAVMEAKNVEVELLTQYDVIKGADGLDYASPKGYQFRYDVKDGFKSSYSNLYNGKKELSDLMHYMINQNWKLMTDVYGRSLLRPLMDTLFYLNRIFSLSVPVDNLIIR